MYEDLIKKTAIFIKKQLANEPTGHDWYHVERVWRTAKQIQSKEGGDLEIIELAALLHDLGDYKHYDLDVDKGILVLRGMMEVIGIPDNLQERILKIVKNSQFRGADTIKPPSLEGRIVQDADWLDSLGAIGVARTFATGGRIERIMHDPNRRIRKKMSGNEYSTKKRDGTSLNFFFEKSLKLPKLLNTATARQLAVKRVKFLELFIKEFLEEWEGKD